MRELEGLLQLRLGPDAAIAIGFDHLDRRIRCYAHIVNICVTHILDSVTSVSGACLSRLKASTDSGYAASHDNSDDDSDGESDDGNIKFCRDIAELQLADSFYDGGNAKLDAWVTGIKRNPLKRARRAIRLLRSSGKNRQTFKAFIPHGNEHNWFKKRKGGERVPVKVPSLDLLRDVKTRWDSAYLMLERLRELRLVCSFR